jgi:ABC-2 type transport system permease protein
MNNVEMIWKKRLVEYNQELRKYLRYMFNDHLLFVLIFAFGGGAYTYNQWVQTLDKDFPAALIMAVCLAILVSWSPIYTFLREADAVYLLPLEQKMNQYFQKSIWISLFFQSYTLLLVLAAFMPMYVKVTGEGFSTFFKWLLLLIILKSWNLFVKWSILKNQEKEVHIIDFIVRLLLNGVLLYFLFNAAAIWISGITAIIMLAYFIYFYRIGMKKSIKWDLLISLEEQRMLLFYRLANMFTDVPKLKGRIHRRKLLDPIVNLVSYGQNQTFNFLFVRSIIRTSEYFGLIIRLTLVSIVLMIVVDSFLFSLFIALLFIYLTGFQLLPLYKRYDMKIWTSIYPISEKIKEKSFQKVVKVVLLSQSILISLGFWLRGEWTGGVICLVVSVLFSLFFSHMYLPSRTKKWKMSE